MSTKKNSIMMAGITSLLALMTVSFLLIPQPERQTLTPNPSGTPIAEGLSTPTAEPIVTSQVTQVDVLQAQLDIMRTYDQKLLSTVYWSLGIVGALVIFVGGYSWWMNSRALTREKELLLAELQISQDAKFDGLSKEMRERFSQLGEKSFEAINQQIAGNKEELETVSSALDESIQSLDGSIQYELGKMKLDIKINDAEVWKIRGVLTNALDSFVNALSIALVIKAKSLYGFILSNILEILDDDEFEYVGSMIAPEIISVVDQLPPEHEATVIKIKEIIQDKLRPGV